MSSCDELPAERGSASLAAEVLLASSRATGPSSLPPSLSEQNKKAQVLTTTKDTKVLLAFDFQLSRSPHQLQEKLQAPILH